MPAEPYLAEIYMFAGNFAPRGFAFCSGQILSIAQNTALFSLLGTTFGGNGQTTFALPDLRGRMPVHAGQGPGLSSYNLGQVGGTESVTLNVNEMPQHSHVLTGQGSVSFPSSSSAGDSDSPNGRVLAASPSGDEQYVSAASANGTTAPVNLDTSGMVVQPAGGSQPHPNLPPYLCVNFVIALEGIYPSRN